MNGKIYESYPDDELLDVMGEVAAMLTLSSEIIETSEIAIGRAQGVLEEVLKDLDVDLLEIEFLEDDSRVGWVVRHLINLNDYSITIEKSMRGPQIFYQIIIADTEPIATMHYSTVVSFLDQIYFAHRLVIESIEGEAPDESVVVDYFPSLKDRNSHDNFLAVAHSINGEVEGVVCENLIEYLELVFEFHPTECVPVIFYLYESLLREGITTSDKFLSYLHSVIEAFDFGDQPGIFFGPILELATVYISKEDHRGLERIISFVKWASNALPFHKTKYIEEIVRKDFVFSSPWKILLFELKALKRGL